MLHGVLVFYPLDNFFFFNNLGMISGHSISDGLGEKEKKNSKYLTWIFVTHVEWSEHASDIYYPIRTRNSGATINGIPIFANNHVIVCVSEDTVTFRC